MESRDEITIGANASGRLWHADPDRWNAMLTHDGCPWCSGPGPPREDLLGETADCWVTGGAVAAILGYACVSTKAHAIEPYDLDPPAQAAFFLDAMTVARALADVFRPPKMNYEIHGNTIPHLHMHLYPRTPGDTYVGYPIHNRAEVTRTPEQLAEMRRAIAGRLEAVGRLI